MRFVEALGSSTLVQHSRPLFDDDGGHEDHDHVPNHHSLAGQGLAHQLALRSGTGAVFDPRIRQPLDGWRLQGSATPLLFWPVHCYFRDVVIMRRRRMVARVARRERPARGNSQLRVSLSTASGCRSPAPTGSDGFGRIRGGFWVSSCTTTWHNYIFDL